jgi:AcrR family transcriptional regulator
VRSAAARDSILTATARLLSAQGYDQLTIEGIAKEAGVGKQTIYRWWPSRGALIAECLLDGRLFAFEPTVPDTGDLRRDLRDWLRPILGFVNSTTGRSLVRSLVAASSGDAALAEHLGEAFGADRLFTDRLLAAVAAGQLPDGAPVDQLGHAILGTLIFQVLSRDEIDIAAFLALTDFMLTPGTPA